MGYKLKLSKYITRTIHNPGSYKVTYQVQNLAWLTDTVSHYVIAYPPAVPMITPFILQATHTYTQAGHILVRADIVDDNGLTNAA